MGKPYAKELNQIGNTYQWANEIEIEFLSKPFSDIKDLPLIIAASGGSLTVAYLISLLREDNDGSITKVMTPLELTSSTQDITKKVVLFISAGGNNIDIVKAFEAIASREPYRVIILCANKKSRLAKLAENYSFVDFVFFDIPGEKDGFLATNSMLAFSVLCCRIWEKSSTKVKLPQDISSLIGDYQNTNAYLQQIKDFSKHIWDSQTICLLYGWLTKPSAINFESNFTEAALGSVQTADYRNFAHGRHHWLAKKGDTTSVVAFITDEDKDIAEKTLDLIPESIKVLRIYLTSKDGVIIEGIIKSLYLTAAAGEHVGIDPGNPKVPEFGRKIYHLRGYKFLKKRNKTFGEYVIERKTKVSDTIDLSNDSFWQISLKQFIGKLTSSSFGGFVFDYDGTLCDRHERFDGIGKDIKQFLMHFLENGIKIGIASGRGKSLKNDLIGKIPKDHWDKVIIGTYNGSNIETLNDVIDEKEIILDEKIEVLDRILKDKKIFSHLFEWETREKQITLWNKDNSSSYSVLNTIQEIIKSNALLGLTVLFSSHSVDVLAPEVSKLSVVERMKEEVGMNQNILCVGDRGAYPGNDFELLSEPYSLSVDEVSIYPESCWNLAPLGSRGVNATLHYFKAINIVNDSFCFDEKKLTSRKRLK